MQFRIGESAASIGVRLSYLDSTTTFDIQPDDGSARSAGDTVDAALGVLFTWDTRDTTFTPNAGRSVKVRWSRSTESLGGDYEYSKFGIASRQYWPLRNGRLIVGLRTDYAYTGEDAPFYSLGFVSLRGVPAFRYLGNQTITVETEARFKLGGRWSIVGFAGAGRAANRFSEIGEAERAYNAGAGFRYLLARKLGLAAGLDAARGPEESAVYLTFGSAWGL